MMTRKISPGSGARIAIVWRSHVGGEPRFFGGRVVKKKWSTSAPRGQEEEDDTNSGVLLHFVAYDDGNKHWHDLTREEWVRFSPD